MNTTKILSSALIAMASLTAVGAFAGDLDDYPAQAGQTVQASTVTRAQVRAELADAQRAGTLLQANDAYPGNAAVASSVKTRDQVRAELRNAQRGGLTQRIDNNYPGDMAQGSGNANVRG
ncbi:MAG: hypothetical protein JWQ88_2533 [Rhodoferax sp.]|nr:hypothetical protein [Rhodoferax sp.]